MIRTEYPNEKRSIQPLPEPEPILPVKPLQIGLAVPDLVQAVKQELVPGQFGKLFLQFLLLFADIASLDPLRLFDFQKPRQTVVQIRGVDRLDQMCIRDRTISHRESIWIPNAFASSDRFFIALAIFPSNISQNPDRARQKMAVLNLPWIAWVIPNTEDARLIYVNITE